MSVSNGPSSSMLTSSVDIRARLPVLLQSAPHCASPRRLLRDRRRRVVPIVGASIAGPLADRMTLLATTSDSPWAR
jgi:hypothetical protein